MTRLRYALAWWRWWRSRPAHRWYFWGPGTDIRWHSRETFALMTERWWAKKPRRED